MVLHHTANQTAVVRLYPHGQLGRFAEVWWAPSLANLVATCKRTGPKSSPSIESIELYRPSIHWTFFRTPPLLRPLPALDLLRRTVPKYGQTTAFESRLSLLHNHSGNLRRDSRSRGPPRPLPVQSTSLQRYAEVYATRNRDMGERQKPNGQGPTVPYSVQTPYSVSILFCACRAPGQSFGVCPSRDGG
jgi:hypothetical protein